MAKTPLVSDTERLALSAHYSAIKQISDRCDISTKGSICTWFPYSDDKLVVEADGLGGAVMMLVCDHYPFDGYNRHHDHSFTDEHEACAAAEWFNTELDDHDSTMSATAFFKLVKRGERPWALEDQGHPYVEPGDGTGESSD